jgi:aspartyl-tRNA(Asn)/glutamyl-tRNA(Gln) amidotransferase subunit A
MLTDSQLAFASIATIGKLFRTRKLSPVELTGFLLARIEKLNPQLNAFLTVTAELALKQAARAESELAKGKGRSPRRDRGALHGILVSLKDNIYTAGIRTTAGSQILRNFVPTKDAPVVTALQNSGAVLVGKTNMHEFAYGASNINPHFGPSRNPWDLARITGGSIRIQSSLCGVVGLKPSLGSVSTKNVVPLSPSLDVVGPMARTVADVVLLWNTVRPSMSSHVQYSAKSNSARARKPRLGIPKEFFFDLLAPDVAAAYDSAIRSLGKNGAQVKKVSLPLIEMTEEAGNQIAWAEALFYHQQSGWFPARSAEYGEDVRSRLEMGTKVSAVTYLQALQSRERFISQFHSLLEEQNLDALVVPTTPITAPLIDEESIAIDGTLHPTRALLLRLNRPANFAGIPAISVPLGMTKNNLPAGLQFIGPLHSDPFLLALSGVFERLRDHSSPAPFPVPPASN